VRKKAKDKKRKRKKKGEKLMTVEEHETACSTSLELFGVLLNMKVPDDNVSADDFLVTDKPIKLKRKRKSRAKAHAAGSHQALRGIAEEVVIISHACGEVRAREVHSTDCVSRPSRRKRWEGTVLG
jgi:hypothetical protein